MRDLIIEARDEYIKYETKKMEHLANVLQKVNKHRSEKNDLDT